MSFISAGRVFAALAAFFIGAAGCSNTSPQKQTKPAEERIETEPVLAGAELPERLEERQARESELDAERPDGDVVEIPLDRIRRGAPGSRQLRDLEPEFFVYRDSPEKIAKYSTREGEAELEKIEDTAEENSLVLAIERALSKLSAGKGITPGPGFAVAGTERAALRGVYDVFVRGNKPTNSFQAGEDLSIVFFSHPVQPRVALDRVEVVDEAIRIHYMLISHGNKLVRWYLALIPCDNLPPGTYKVEMIRSLEREKKYNQRDFPPIQPGTEDYIVCRPFSFEVQATDLR